MTKFAAVTCLTILCALATSAHADSLESARKYLQAEKPKQALEVLARLPEQSSNAEFAYLMADAYLGINQVDQAIRYASKALELDAGVSEHHTVLADALSTQLINGSGGAFKKLGQLKKLRKNYEAAVELDPSNVRARAGLAQIYVMAPGFAGGSKKKAMQQAQAVYEIDKRRSYPLLAAVYRKEKDNDKAQEILELWNSEYPDDWGAFFNLSLLAQDNNDSDRAFAHIEKWLALHPEHGPANYQLGRLSAITGLNLDAGAEGLRKYLLTPVERMQPGYHHAHRRLAVIYQQQGDIDKAKAEVQKGLQYAPDDKELRKLSRQL